jgi:lipopolysaccharide export system permease protein
MSRISIYVIKEISSSFLFIFSFVTLVVWLSQALRNLEILSSDNVTIVSYFFYTLLLIPKLTLVTIPIAIFLGIIVALNKLRIDSELIIFGSTGNSNRDILLKPLLIISIFFFSVTLFLSIYLVPLTSSEIRSQITEIRSTNLSATILKEKRFITPDNNLTVFFKEVSDQNLYGILLHDRSEKNNIKTYVAKNGYLDNSKGSSIYLYEGTMQILDATDNKITEIDFDSYSINLNNFEKKEKGYLFADEESTVSLIKKIFDKSHNSEEFGVLHNRFVKALYIFCLVFLPLIIFKLIKKPDDKASIIISIIIIIGILIKFSEITMESLLIGNNNLILLNYSLPILILIGIISFLYLNTNLIREKIKK